MAPHATPYGADTIPPRHRLKNPFTMSKSRRRNARAPATDKSAPEYVVFISGVTRVVEPIGIEPMT